MVNNTAEEYRSNWPTIFSVTNTHAITKLAVTSNIAVRNQESLAKGLRK